MMNFPEPPDDIFLTGASDVRSVLLPIVYIQGARARKKEVEFVCGSALTHCTQEALWARMSILFGDDSQKVKGLLGTHKRSPLHRFAPP